MGTHSNSEKSQNMQFSEKNKSARCTVDQENLKSSAGSLLTLHIRDSRLAGGGENPAKPSKTKGNSDTPAQNGPT